MSPEAAERSTSTAVSSASATLRAQGTVRYSEGGYFTVWRKPSGLTGCNRDGSAITFPLTRAQGIDFALCLLQSAS